MSFQWCYGEFVAVVNLCFALKYFPNFGFRSRAMKKTKYDISNVYSTMASVEMSSTSGSSSGLDLLSGESLVQIVETISERRWELLAVL